VTRFGGSVGVLVLVLGCGTSERPDRPLVVDVPASLGVELPQPEHNPMTEHGVELGRRLFFDAALSGRGDISCASCHRLELAFSDGLRRSVGAAGTALPRHTPALINLAWSPGFFWDGGAKNLESQVFAPLTSPDEMGQDLDRLMDLLRADPVYSQMFARAFADGLTLANVVRAIAQYERTLISADSRYDRFVSGQLGALDEREREGLAAFERHCASCHVPGFFTDHGFHNNGLDAGFPEDDERIAWGRGRITNRPDDIGKYKTPTLRNVSVTAPYMHDGRFVTLHDVIEHYRHGVLRSPTLAPELIAQDGTPGLSMTDAEAQAIVVFLATLTDPSLESWVEPETAVRTPASTPQQG
jgi:cytochrome c peroxidase